MYTNLMLFRTRATPMQVLGGYKGVVVIRWSVIDDWWLEVYRHSWDSCMPRDFVTEYQLMDVQYELHDNGA